LSPFKKPYFILSARGRQRLIKLLLGVTAIPAHYAEIRLIAYNNNLLLKTRNKD